VTYPDPQIAATLADHFVACKLLNSEHALRMRQFNIRWLPGQVILSPRNERLHHAWIGYLPPADYGIELLFARGMAAYETRDIAGGIAHWEQLVASAPTNERAVEALYWVGVAAYRQAESAGAAHPLDAAAAAWRRLVDTYPQSSWARKVEIFLEPGAVA
jgi:hypothetical protein